MARRADRIRHLLLAVLLISTLSAMAQDEPEYRLDMGAGAGLVTYTGDFNGNLLKGMQPWGTLIAKYHLSPRAAVAFNLGMGKIKGSSDKAETWYPIAPYEFNNTLTAGVIRYEYNFWAYGTGREYRGAKPLTPFLAFGLGFTYADTPSGGQTAANLPIGAGIKYKVSDRLNLTAEWRIHFTGSDNLDGVSDPYGIKSSGLFKNTDCYSVIQLSLTYDIWAKCKTCNNDRD
jgi:hypothetical protein